MILSPTLRRKIVEPLLISRRKRPLLTYWKELEKSQFLPEEKLRESQWIKLKQLLEFAYLENEYYRKRFDKVGVKPKDIKTLEDTSNLPILTKEDIRDNEDEIISKGYHKPNLLEAKTGGSTGKPLQLYFTEECSEYRNACARRHDRWSGWEVGEPKGCVWGNTEYSVGLKAKLYSALLSPIIYLDTMAITEDAVIKFCEEWKRYKPTLLYGHAHSLYILSKIVMERSIHGITPKAVISSSMMLMPNERSVIENAFGVKVSDRYGCEEVGLISSECEKHEGMHINIDNLFVEFIKEDGTHAKSDELGYIIVTDLSNKAMPLIRYRIEDMGIPLDQKCSCGRGLPLMDKVAGRTADFLIKNDGTKVAGVSLIERTLTAINGIQQMQIVQEELSNINLNIVKGKEYDDNSENLLLEEFKHVFGRDVNISLKYLLDNIPQEPSGKYRFSICNINS